MTHVFMFPGQSSRYVGMLDRAAEVCRGAADVIALASDTLGRDLAKIYREGDESLFEKNRNVQVGVFLTTHLHLSALNARGIDADLSLGLSLGEYNHLVHIGALEFVDALRLVDARGRVYDEGPRGMMAALFPVDREMVDEILQKARGKGVVEIANLNSPAQFVVAGETIAVEEAMRIADEEFSVTPAPIERQIPMHTSVFRPASEGLAPYLETAPFKKPTRPYVSNVLGTLVPAPTPEQFRDLLTRHVYSPVRWQDSIDAIAERYPNAVFVEVGPRGVLYNLLQKRWRSNKKYKTDASENPTEHFHALVELLRTPLASTGA
jgi:[acyl-carrier-protein] S-malonyltransferase